MHAPAFVIGTLLDGAGWILQVLALTQASLTFVQPALGMGVFLLLAFAWLGLDQKPRGSDILSGAALAGGIALISSRAPSPGSAIAWAHAIVPVALLTLFAVAPYLVRTLRRPVLLALATGAAFSVTGLTSEVVSRGLSEHRLMLALVGLAASIAFGLLGFLAQTSALVTGNVTAVVPVVLLIDTAVPVALAPVLFGERWPSGTGQISVLFTGLLLAIFGAASLASSPRVAVVHARAADA